MTSFDDQPSFMVIMLIIFMVRLCRSTLDDFCFDGGFFIFDFKKKYNTGLLFQLLCVWHFFEIMK